uniref:Uncharacterized protein n=1 Tax=Lotus japonicus TaxID=34305 RepID=I3S0C5_LOTJA|nr:unknown [Lotus japonicus]
MSKLEFLQLYEVHPWLHPNFGFINLLLSAINCFQCKIIYFTCYHLFLGFQYPCKFKKGILFFVMFMNGETSKVFNCSTVRSSIACSQIHCNDVVVVVVVVLLRA